MKSLKLFQYILVFFIFSSLYLVVKQFKIISEPAIPFIYELKTKKVKAVTYLDESNSSVLAPTKYTVGIFSIGKETFELKEVFQIAGIPHIITHNLEDLNKTSMLFLDFNIDKPPHLPQKTIDFFYKYVERGGIIIGNGVLSYKKGLLKKLFGYRRYIATKKHKEVHLVSSDYYKYFNTTEEKNYLLSTINQAPYTNTLVLGTATGIAFYEDNETAISINEYGKGKAINLGISLYDLRYRNLLAKDFHANKKYINDFEPLSDFIIFFLKSVYEKHLEKSLTLHTSKDGNQATVIMTHDISLAESIANIPQFTKSQKKLDIKATYNIQVKYMTDNKDKAFFMLKNFDYLLNVEKEGHEIGSHAIVHTKNFFILPRGDCTEAYPEYKPFSLSNLVDLGNPTACGEVKVAKELLLGTGIKTVETFRSGELLYHPNLPEVLEETGYRYSSCLSAEDILSYFPFRYMKNYTTLQEPSKIWEIPLVLEDEFFPPLYFRVGKAVELFTKVYDNGGVYTILNHTDLTWYKLKNLDIEFMEAFYEQLPKDVWKDTMGNVGAFWDKRDRIVFRYEIDRKELTLKIHSLSDIEGLTFKMDNLNIMEDENIQIINNKLVLNVEKGMNEWLLNLY